MVVDLHTSVDPVQRLRERRDANDAASATWPRTRGTLETALDRQVRLGVAPCAPELLADHQEGREEAARAGRAHAPADGARRWQLEGSDSSGMRASGSLSALSRIRSSALVASCFSCRPASSLMASSSLLPARKSATSSRRSALGDSSESLALQRKLARLELRSHMPGSFESAIFLPAHSARACRGNPGASGRCRGACRLSFDRAPVVGVGK